MKPKNYLPALALALGLLLAGCQSTASNVASSPSASGASSPVSSGMAASSNAAASSTRPLAITEEFISPQTVANIENLGDYIQDFEYKDVKADSIDATWAELMKRAVITGLPKGMLEYAEYTLYQNYLDMATYYGTDLDTMLKEQMNITHDEMVAEIQTEAKNYINAGLVARYILDKEDVVTLDALAEVNQYILSGGAPEATGGASSLATASQSTGELPAPPTALSITTEQALALANGWIEENLVAAPAA